MQFCGISVRTSQRTCHELCPFITLGKPATGLCLHFSVKLGQGGQLTDEAKCENSMKTYWHEKRENTSENSAYKAEQLSYNSKLMKM